MATIQPVNGIVAAVGAELMPGCSVPFSPPLAWSRGTDVEQRDILRTHTAERRHISSF